MRLVIGSIVILSLIVLFLFALFPANVSVTRMVQISSPEDSIRNRISDLRTWASWNEFANVPGKKNNPDTKPDSVQADYLRIDGSEISVSGVSHNYVNTLWKRGNRMFTGRFMIDDSKGQPVVIWTMNFNIKWYPWEKLASMFYEKQLGPLMEKSLVQLQNELER